MKRIDSLLKVVLVACCIAASSAMMAAQTLNVYNVNTSNFPKIKADYVAFDPSGNPISGLTALNFRVSETPQGGTAKDLTSTIKHTCDSVVGDPAASIVLVVDNSNSMFAEVNGKPRFTYVKEALKAFISRVKFNGETSISIISFSGNSVLVSDWETTAGPLQASIDTMKIGTATRYDVAFESIPNIYDQFASRKPTIPKYVFFLTDGTPNPLMDKPNEFVARNVDRCNAEGIRVFAITILETQAHYTIEQIAKGTGGKSIVTTEDKLIDLYSLLALETQVRSLCSIEWTSPFACVEQHRNRTAVITLAVAPSNPTATVSYTTPPNSIASVTISDPVLFVGDPNPNTSSVAIVTITAVGAPLAVSSFAINPSTNFTVLDWNVDFPQPTFAPFTLNAGQSRRIRVQFTQGPTRTFRQATLALAGSPCPPTIVLVAGTGVISLQSPIGGELFSTCDTVTIKWAGVLPTQPVTIKYSDDDGATYPNVITANATGLSYKWLPPQPGVRYRIQVSASPAKQFQWAKGYGGTGNETASSVAVCSNGGRIYATGYFDGPAQFGTFNVANAAGDTDGYFLELDADGNVVRLVTLEGSNSNDDRIIGVITDDECNHYVAGYFSSPTANFGSLSLVLPNLTQRSMFIYKFREDGALVWNQTAGGDGTRASTVDCTNLGIRYIGGVPQVVVTGNFTRFIDAGINPSGGRIQYTGTTATRPYFITYDVVGNPTLSPNATAPTGFVYKNTVVNDTNNFTYETGTFSGGKTFGTPTAITIGSKGGTDAFVSKQGAPPSSTDASDAAFSVKAPTLAFTIAKAVMNPIAQGQRINTSFTAVLKNTGDFPVVITNQLIAGVQPADFILLTNVLGTRLNPGESISLEFEFAPSGTGIRTAELRVDGSCGTTATLALEGNGLPPCVWAAVADTSLGKFALGQPGQRTITCVLKNNGPNVLSGTLTVIGDVSDITVATLGAFSLQPGQCKDVTVNVTPTSGGVKSVKLGYGLATECGVPETTISCEIVEPRVTIDNVDLGARRLLTQTDTALYITNLNTEPATITGIRAVDINNVNFANVVLPGGLPITLQPQATQRVPVSYIPRDRAAHSISVFVTVTGQAAELEGVVKGSGFLAEILATGHVFGQWSVTSPTPAPGLGYITIDNVDSESALIIDSIDFSALAPDFIVGTQPTYPQQLLPSDPALQIPVQFSPKTVGMITRPVRIWHQAKPGPGPVPPDTSTVVDVIGEGISSSDLTPLDFGDVLTCATKTLTVTISNPNASLPLNCQPAVGSGDVGSFSLSEPGPFTIAGGGSYTMTVVFSPQAPGNQAASFVIENDQNLALTINASGRGVTANADFRFGTIPQAIIGSSVMTPIEVTVGDIDTVHVTDVVLTIRHSAEYLGFKMFNDVLSQAGWTFTADPVTVPGILVVRGTAAGTATLVSGAFVAPVFNAYLTGDSTLGISVDAAVQMSCIVPTGDSSSITMKLVCNSASRLVRLGSAQFMLGNPMPNPATDRTLIAYSTGTSDVTTFDILDQIGTVVKTVTTAPSPSAAYELDLYTDDLASGIYYLRMISGPFSATRTLNVIR